MAKKKNKFCYEIYSTNQLLFVVHANTTEGLKEKLADFGFTMIRSNQLQRQQDISFGTVEGYMMTAPNNLLVLNYKRKSN